VVSRNWASFSFRRDERRRVTIKKTWEIGWLPWLPQPTIHGKNKFAEISKNLTIRSKIQIWKFLMNYQNNYVRYSNQLLKYQNFLQHCSSCLSFLHNYFDNPTKLLGYFSKTILPMQFSLLSLFLTLPLLIFFLCIIHLLPSSDCQIFFRPRIASKCTRAISSSFQNIARVENYCTGGSKNCTRFCERHKKFRVSTGLYNFSGLITRSCRFVALRPCFYTSAISLIYRGQSVVIDARSSMGITDYRDEL